MPDDLIKKEGIGQKPISPVSQEGDVIKEKPLAVEQAPIIEEKLEQPSAQGQAQQAPPAPAQKDDGKVTALKEAEKLRGITAEGAKLDFLLETAQSKGVAFAVEVVKKINDPCLLDLLHDKLVERGIK